jgi:putative peptidoglycan lipid II flippase
MYKKGFIITLIFVLSTLIQLVSQIFITRIFGASITLDTFLASVALPTIIVTVIYATFNDAFLPILGEKRAKDPENADQFFFSHFISLTLISFIFSVILMAFSGVIANLMYVGRGVQFVNEVSYQMRFLFLSIPLAVTTTLLGTYLYSIKKFNRFPLAQLTGNLINLVLIILLSKYLGIWSLIIGFVFSVTVQIFIVFNFRLLTQSFKFTNLIPFLTALTPLIVGSFAVRSDTLIVRSYGALMPEGSLVYLNLISKIFSLATGIVTIGIQVLLLPHLVEYISKKEYEKTILYVNKAKVFGILSTLVAITLIVLLAPVFINLLFVGGKFTIEDAKNTSSLIPFFIIPSIAWGVNSIFFQPLIALKKQLQLGFLNLSALFLAFLSAYITNYISEPFYAIIVGITVLLLTGIIGSEILWQHYKKKLLKSQ